MSELMQHSKHGLMHVYSNSEKERVIANGWFPVPDKPIAKEVVAVPEIAETTSFMPTMFKQRGRPRKAQ